MCGVEERVEIEGIRVGKGVKEWLSTVVRKIKKVVSDWR